jgi:opacity protein-like surface antigen
MSFKMLSMTSAVAACAAAAAIGSAVTAAAEPAPNDCVTVDAATVCDPSGNLVTPPEGGGNGSGGAGGAGAANNQNGVYGPAGDTPPVG